MGRSRQSGGGSQSDDGDGDVDDDFDSDPPEFVDRVSKRVDIKSLRVTQLPYNPSVCMPWAVDGELELRLHHMKVGVRDAVRKMVSKSAKWGNVGEVERNGLEKLCRKVKAGEIVCFVTDKSGRMSCDSLQNYKRACQAELSDESKTPEISMEDHDRAEREINAEGLALLRMLGLNDDTAGERLRKAIVAEGVRIPPLYGMRKDHKEVRPGDEELGPRVRPVCGAEDCVTKRVSYILCMLLSHLIPENGTHCWSTDDLLSEFERVNSNQVVDKEWIVGSLDVDSLYPSLDIDRCARVVSEKLFHSDLKFEKLVWKEIALYLRFHLTDEQIAAEGLDRICPQARSSMGRPPTFVASGSDLNLDVRYGPWVFRRRSPSRAVVRRMFCSAVRLMIVKTMSLHDFQLDGQLYRQSRGGSIGLDLTGVVWDVYMCEWDRHLIGLMEDAHMETVVYKHYKDDVDFIFHGRQMLLQG